METAHADLSDPRIQNLLATHTRRALSSARCREGHALDLDALRRIDAGHAEQKNENPVTQLNRNPGWAQASAPLSYSC